MTLQHELTPTDNQPGERRGFFKGILGRLGAGAAVDTSVTVDTVTPVATAEIAGADFEQGTLDEVAAARQAEIAEHPLLQEIPVAERQEASAQAFELYEAARTYVAPVVTGFADSLLSEAEERQILFAGRDGLGAFLAAGQLKQKFDYGNDDPDQLAYSYLTRKLVYSSTPQQLSEYVEDCGVHDPEASLLLADIGMYGSIVPVIKQSMPNVETRYLISKAQGIPGYADGAEHRMRSLQRIPGNPATHFMEDTFSGPTASPDHLEESGGKLVAAGGEARFTPADVLKREFALKAIEDYAASLSERPAQPGTEAIDRLDDFLADTSNYSRLMVPHIR